jgi:hypothetical protein
MPEINIIASSAATTGAVNKNANNSRFSLNFEGKGIDIPREATDVQLSMPHALVWNTIPNITAVNNKMEITGLNTSDVSTVFTIEVPQGLYDLDSLNSSIQAQLVNQGAKTSPDLIDLQANYSTNKVEIIFNYNTVVVDFNVADSLKDIMGFAAASYGVYTEGYVLAAPEIAQFNAVNGVIIHCSLASEGIRIGNDFSQAIGQIGFTVSPGSLETYQPFNVLKISESHLAGVSIKSLTFWITDEQENDIVMTEEWSSTLRISWRD